MRSDESAQRWLDSDLGRLWEEATALGVHPTAPTPRQEVTEPAHFAAGQCCLVRMRVDATPKDVEWTCSVSLPP